jgi:hypothetical protein
MTPILWTRRDPSKPDAAADELAAAVWETTIPYRLAEMFLYAPLAKRDPAHKAEAAREAHDRLRRGLDRKHEAEIAIARRTRPGSPDAQKAGEISERAILREMHVLIADEARRVLRVRLAENGAGEGGEPTTPDPTPKGPCPVFRRPARHP